MKTKSTIILLAAIAVAAIVAYNLSLKPTSEELREQRKLVLAGLKPDNVRSISIQSDGQTITCERSEPGSDQWHITAPRRLRAEKWKVQGILRRFETAKKTGRVYPEKNKPLPLEEYGLKSPRKTVTVREFGPAGRTWMLLIGEEIGAGGTVWAKLADREVAFGIKKTVAEKTDVTLNGLRSKKLAARMETSDLETVNIRAAEWKDQAGFAATCARSDGTWEIEEPFKDLADGDKVEKLATAVNNHYLVEDDFVVDDPTKAGQYGLDDPLLSLTYELPDRTVDLVFGAAQQEDEQKYYAMNKTENAIVSVPDSLIEKLRKAPDKLRERSLLTFTTEDVRRVVAARGDRKTVLERLDEGWKITGENPADADETVMGDLLSGLKDAEVVEFVENSPADLSTYELDEKQRWEVRLEGEEGETLGKLFLGKEGEKGETLYARRPGYLPLLTVQKQDCLRNLLGGRLWLLDRLVMEEPETRALKVDLTHGGGHFVCERRSATAEWEMLKPVEGPVDQAALDDLLFELENLRARTFVAESAEDLSPFGLDEPRMTLSVTYKQKESGEGADEEQEAEDEKQDRAPETYTKTLLVGNERGQDPAGHLATLEGDGRVFVLGDSVVDNLRANLASRQISRADELRRLVFTRGELSRTFTYDEDAGKWTGPDGAELPDETADRVKKAADLLEDFEGTRVAAYVEKSAAEYGFDRPYLVVELDEKTTKGKKVVVGKKADAQGRFVKGPATGFVVVAAPGDLATLAGPTTKPEEPEKTPEKQEEEAGEKE